MTERPCPTEAELDHAFSVGVDAGLAAHIDRCVSCRAVWDATREVVELAQELPVATPSVRDREERRTALLAAWQPPVLEAPVLGSADPEQPVIDEAAVIDRPRPRLRRRWLMSAVALAVAASVIVGTKLAPRQPERTPARVAYQRRGVVYPHDGARFTLAAQPPDEMVRLRDGVIDVDVAPLQPGERFRVVVGTDEVEVHGTSFEVIAAGDRLVSVRVVHGLVEVRHVGAAPVFLTERESWPTVTASVVPPVPGPAPVLAPPPDLRPPHDPATPVTRHGAARHLRPRPADAMEAPVAPALAASPQELGFVEGWQAMRQQSFAAAADAFARARAAAPDGPLAEDAAFWHAVALTRLRRTADAIVALRGFIAAYPDTPRAGHAAVMLARLLIETGDLAEARRRFESAAHDRDPEVRAGASAGLDDLLRRAP